MSSADRTEGSCSAAERTVGKNQSEKWRAFAEIIWAVAQASVIHRQTSDFARILPTKNL